LSAWFCALAADLDKRSAWRLLLLLPGVLLATGRRTVTSWLRAAWITDAFRPAYHALFAVGNRSCQIAGQLLFAVLLPMIRQISDEPLRFALDDTPTKRYGPDIQGAGIHHNPTPGRAGEKRFYGHLWVTLAWLADHSSCGVLALPLRALLYVRQKDVAQLNQEYPWTFRTKLQLGVELVVWLLGWVKPLGKAVWLVVDGAYAKAPFLRPLLGQGVVLVSRLRKDAHLCDLPPSQRKPGQRGPMPRYGKKRIELCKRAGQKRGWQQLECVQYGQKVLKRVKTLLATWHPVGGAIRVVLVQEEEGWLPFFCTDTTASVVAILEAVAARGAIEQGYQQMKEELGLDHFEGRSWRGFHHHAALVLLAYGFLLLERHRRQEHPVEPGKKGVHSRC
jgi:hypothetical protein